MDADAWEGNSVGPHDELIKQSGACLSAGAAFNILAFNSAELEADVQ
jgi:hypothetical protein